MNQRSLIMSRAAGLAMTVVFALVGGLFLFLPGEVIAFFNALSGQMGLSKVPPAGRTFFEALAVAYMYLVTLLAWRMYRVPEQRIYPLLLGHAKFASSVLSFGLFFFHAPWLIYLVNGIVDAGLGLLAMRIAYRVCSEAKEGAS